MTERLYYDDAYLTHFTARVVERFTYHDQPAVVLDRTAFYPTSGGQPCDQGVLGAVKVVDVWLRETDGAVIHLLEKSLHLPPELTDQQLSVVAEIDWQRRFDHMQQHTGQHILSQAFSQVAQAETVSFHLGTTGATIDLHGPRRLAVADMDRAESLANQILWEDRPVNTQIVGAAELADLPLRKPPAVAGDVRVIQVADFDWSACGGTHVARTGQIGLIKIIKWEKRGAETRVEFLCGQRALQDYGQKNSMVNHLAAGFNVGHWELDQAVKRLKVQAKDLRSRLREAGRELAAYRAAELRAAAPHVAGVRLIALNLTEEPVLGMRELARQLVSESGVVALLGLADGAGDLKAQLCFARSSDVAIDMVALVRDAGTARGSQGVSGGGPADFAQGGGPLADVQQLDAILERATRKLCQQLKRVE
jgi:alanyl-tRNA synthetase